MAKVVFLGTPEYGIPVLRALAAHHDVLAVVTRPDRPAGRGRGRPLPSAVKRAAEALGIEVSPAVAARRAVLLELERLYNHVADLGMIANDVGFGIAHIHTQRLREKLLRHNAAVTGHRLLRGGVGVGSAQWATEPDLALVAEVAAEVAEIVALTLDHSVVLDRFTGTAVLPGELARNLGTLGYVARASGLTVDARADHPQVDLGPGFTPVTQEGGDVLARYAVRASEFAASAALLPRLIGLAVAGGGGSVAAAGLGGERTAYDALRVAYRRELVGIAALDLSAPDPVAHLGYSARGADVTDVVVAGRRLMAGGRLTTLDEEAIRADAARRVARIAAELPVRGRRTRKVEGDATLG